MKLKRELSLLRAGSKASKLAGRKFRMLSAYMVLSFYNFHERSEFTSIFTSALISETSVKDKHYHQSSVKFYDIVFCVQIHPPKISISPIHSYINIYYTLILRKLYNV